jgi:hypothetical protein
MHLTCVAQEQGTWIALLTLYAGLWLAGLPIEPQPELSLTHSCQCGSFEFVSTFPVTMSESEQNRYAYPNLLDARLSHIVEKDLALTLLND